MRSAQLSRGATRRPFAVIPACVSVAIMILWAAHDGGYDEDTWYWGALAMLALLVVAWINRDSLRATDLPRTLIVALCAFAGYVAWSYLSITWASSQGDALAGSNRALLYLAVFALFVITPWTPRSVLGILTIYALALGVIAVIVLGQMATGHGAHSLFVEGRLESPTGYINSTAALFTSGALLGTGLSVRKEIPSLLRGLLVASACACLQLALLAQSRGWLFTLPLVLVAAIVVSRDRLRITAAALLPTIATLGPLKPLLDVFKTAEASPFSEARFLVSAHHAARICLLVCAAVFVFATLLAVVDGRLRGRQLAPGRRLILGTVVAVIAVSAAVGGAFAATHGHLPSFVSRELSGFVHPSAATTTAGTHFAAVGTSRYDAWRVSLDAALAHPVGGLGQDNFADYYLVHRHTEKELAWTHSLEFRVLAHTGFVGAVIFCTFLIAALLTAVRARTSSDAMTAAVAGLALLPLVVWLIHGSVDWFWEMPALSGPALGFLAMVGTLSAGEVRSDQTGRMRLPRGARTLARPLPRLAGTIAGAGALCAAVVALGFPYLSVREVSAASDVRARNPAAALDDLRRAAKLNPLSAEPGRTAGTIALLNGRFGRAESSFRQAIAREPGGWFAWLGLGLAASSLGDSAEARQALQRAASINSKQPAVTEALRRIDSSRPLTPTQAFKLLVLAH
jgi:hypothetical protein